MEAVDSCFKQLPGIIESLLEIQVSSLRIFLYDCQEVVECAVETIVFLLEGVNVLESIDAILGVGWKSQRVVAHIRNMHRVRYSILHLLYHWIGQDIVWNVEAACSLNENKKHASAKRPPTHGYI